MTVDEIVQAFGSIFSMLWKAQLLGMPILFWFVIIALFGIIGGFIKGGKDK